MYKWNNESYSKQIYNHDFGKYKAWGPTQIALATACLWDTHLYCGKEDEQQFEEMVGRSEKLLLHRPVEHRHQAAAASKISGGGVEGNKNTAGYDAVRQ